MIRYPVTPLEAAVAAKLAEYQLQVDSEPSYADQVAKGKKLFKSANTATNRTFKAVRAKLATLCPGARRCMYCEDSVADEVEHVLPKDLYPGQVFAWENYIYACGPCNGGKSGRFQIIKSSRLIDITRPSTAPVIPPETGDPALIDPRTQDGAKFLELDLRGTFFFHALPGLSTADKLRAKATLDILKLNERDYLIEARRSAYGTYRARLREYTTLKSSGATLAELELLKEALLRQHHPTVWVEMKRQRESHPELKRLFTQVPEALTWRVP